MNQSEKRVEWKALLAEREASGASRAEFCRECGLSIKSFGYWQRQFRAPVSNPPSKLVRVGFERANAEPPHAAAFSLRLPGGVTIDARKLPDPAWIKRLSDAFAAYAAR